MGILCTVWCTVVVVVVARLGNAGIAIVDFHSPDTPHRHRHRQRLKHTIWPPQSCRPSDRSRPANRRRTAASQNAQQTTSHASRRRRAPSEHSTETKPARFLTHGTAERLGVECLAKTTAELRPLKPHLPLTHPLPELCSVAPLAPHEEFQLFAVSMAACNDDTDAAAATASTKFLINQFAQQFSAVNIILGLCHRRPTRRRNHMALDFLQTLVFALQLCRRLGCARRRKMNATHTAHRYVDITLHGIAVCLRSLSAIAFWGAASAAAAAAAAFARCLLIISTTVSECDCDDDTDAAHRRVVEQSRLLGRPCIDAVRPHRRRRLRRPSLTNFALAERFNERATEQSQGNFVLV